MDTTSLTIILVGFLAFLFAFGFVAMTLMIKQSREPNPEYDTLYEGALKLAVERGIKVNLR